MRASLLPTAWRGRSLCGWVLLAGSACAVEAELPISTSIATIPPPEVQVVATSSGLYVDGARVGATDDAAALRAALTERADAHQAAGALNPSAPPFRGAASLEVDRHLPARVLVDVIGSCVASGFTKPWVVVESRAAGRAGIRLAAPAPAQLAAAAPDATPSADPDGGYANPTVSLHPERGYHVHVHDQVYGGDPGLDLPCTATPCGPGRYPAVDLNRLMRRVKLDHPRDRSVILRVGGGEVQDLVNLFDATRDDRVAGRGAVELFPDVLLDGVAP